MSTAEAIAPAAPKWKPSLLDSVGLFVVALGVIWIIWNFVSGPKQVGQILAIGLSNGALYALIALGYTMVYGIIELINFAHGDLFMLGSVLGAIILEEWMNQTSSSGTAWLLLAIALVGTMILCAAINMTIERLAYRRLRNAPKLAPLITAVGVSFILQNIGIKLNGSAPHSRTSVLPKSSVGIGGIDSADQLPRGGGGRYPAASAHDVDRAEDEGRQGHASHRAGS